MLYLQNSCELGQVNNVFLIVMITAVMAIATSIIAVLADLLPAAFSGNSSQPVADALVNSTIASPGH